MTTATVKPGRLRPIRAGAALALAGLLAGCLPPPDGGPESAQQGPTAQERIQQRLDALESDLAELKRASSASSGMQQGLESLTVEVEDLRQEVRSQQGTLEVVQHRLDRLAERQRRLYEDVDSRLRTLEKGGGGGAGAATGDGGQGDDAGPDAGGDVGGGSAESAYKAAFAEIEANEYEAAAQAFQGFLEQHPDSDLVPNARYWLGESHYVLRDFEQALVEFNKVLQSHPDSRKAPAALLKIGYAFYELGEYDSARQALQRVRERFPEASEARLARQRLNRMEEEGH
jgi:tol-pal system protein YbgF